MQIHFFILPTSATLSCTSDHQQFVYSVLSKQELFLMVCLCSCSDCSQHMMQRKGVLRVKSQSLFRMEAIAISLEAIALRLEAIALSLEAIALRMEAIALRLEDRS